MPAQLREPLTLRQLELLVYVANGYTAEEIAEAEFLSVSTVRNHLAAAKKRAGAKTLPQLTAILVSAGLLFHIEGTN